MHLPRPVLPWIVLPPTSMPSSPVIEFRHARNNCKGSAGSERILAVDRCSHSRPRRGCCDGPRRLGGNGCAGPIAAGQALRHSRSHRTPHFRHLDGDRVNRRPETHPLRVRPWHYVFRYRRGLPDGGPRARREEYRDRALRRPRKGRHHLEDCDEERYASRRGSMRVFVASTPTTSTSI